MSYKNLTSRAPRLTDAIDAYLGHLTGDDQEAMAAIWALYLTQPMHLSAPIAATLVGLAEERIETRETDGWGDLHVPAGNRGQALVAPDERILAWAGTPRAGVVVNVATNVKGA